jgi:hypothetical protein
MDRSADDPQRPEEPDDPIADAGEQPDDDESGVDGERRSDDDYVPV